MNSRDVLVLRRVALQPGADYGEFSLPLTFVTQGKQLFKGVVPGDRVPFRRW